MATTPVHGPSTRKLGRSPHGTATETAFRPPWSTFPTSRSLNRDYGRAETYAEDAVRLARELGHEVAELVALLNLGLASLNRGHDKQARATLREAVRLSLALRYPDGLVVGLEGLAALDAGQGDPLRAARLMGAADALLETGGSVLERSERELHERTLAAVGTFLDREEFESAWRKGRALSLEDAADEALATNP